MIDSNSTLTFIYEEIKNVFFQKDSYDETLEKVKKLVKEMGFYYDVEQSSYLAFSEKIESNHFMNPTHIEADSFEKLLFEFYWETKETAYKSKENIISYKLFEILKKKRW